MSGKKFRFSLGSVLKLRAHESECARQALAEIRQEVHRQERALLDAEANLASVVQQRATGSTGQRSLSRHEAFRQDAQDEVELARRKLAALRLREEGARLALIEKRGAEKAISQLEEQERTRHWKQFEAAEGHQMDERAITGYHRQRRTAGL